MAERIQKAKAKTSRKDEDTPSEKAARKRAEKVKEDLDSVLDDIDSVLEENAQEFVDQYVQRGGE